MGTSDSGLTADVSDAITADTLGLASSTKIVTATSKDTSVAKVTDVVTESADVAADAVNMGQVAASTDASAGTYIKSFKITAVGAGSTYIDVKIIDTATSTESHKYIPVKVSSDKKLKSKTAAEIKIEVTDKNPDENGGSATYEVKVESMENGTVTANPSSGVAEGAEVTLEIKPVPGYTLDTLTVDGTDKTSDVAEGKYTFTMPAGNVTVSAVFKAVSKLGSKVSPDAEGDIVFSDGSAVPYTADLTDAQKQAAVAVIFYAGSASDTLGAKTLGVGLKQGSSLAWAKSDTTGCTKIFSTSDTDGSENWDVITRTDAAGAAVAATNYPAFNFANTYGVSVAGEESGWYLPARSELSLLYERYHADGSAVRGALSKCMATINLSTDSFWSSSQHASNSGSAWVVFFRPGALSNGDKFSPYSVCAVRAFN